MNPEMPDEFGMIPPRKHEHESVEPVVDTPPLTEYEIPPYIIEKINPEQYLEEKIFFMPESSLHKPFHSRLFEKEIKVEFLRHYVEQEYHFFGNSTSSTAAPEAPAEPEKLKLPYPSYEGWRADFISQDDGEADVQTPEILGKIGQYEVIKSTTTFEDIGGNELAKDVLLEIAGQFAEPEIYVKWGVPVPKGVLLYGKPGTGKTMLAKAFAQKADAAFVEVPVASLRDAYYGESEKKLKALFDNAAKHKGQVVIFFDEIDALLPDRAAINPSHPDAQLVNTFLQSMDGMKSATNVMVLGATNFQERLDPAAIRPGRFDRKVQIELPDSAACKDIMARQLLRSEKDTGRVLVDDELDLTEIGNLLAGLSGAAIAEVVNRVKRTMAQTERAMRKTAAEEDGQDIGFDDSQIDGLKIGTVDISRAITSYLLNG